MTSSRFASLLVTVLWLAAGAPARGESARDAYNRGLALYAAGSFGDAADAFLVAYRQKPKALILFNVGQAFRKKGDLDQALVYYRRFLDEATPDERAPLAEETRKYVHEIEAEQALKRSLIDSADREEANALKFDKRPAAAPTAPATAPPTTAATTATATSPAPAAPAGAAAPAATATTELPPAKTPLHRRWWLWTAVGVAAVGIAVGVGVGVGARSNDPSTALGTRQPTF